MDQRAATNESELPIQRAEIGPWQFSLQRLFVWTVIAALLSFVGVKAGWQYAVVAFPTCAILAMARSFQQGIKRAIVAFLFFTAPMLFFVSLELVRVVDSTVCYPHPQTEIDSLDQAMLIFKMRDGVYPPNFCDAKAVDEFWNKYFPYALERPPTDLDPAEALVFWLSGFSPDRTKPLTGDGVRQPLFPFAQSRLKGTYPHQTYVADLDCMNKPFVYFDVSRSYKKPPLYENLTPYTIKTTGRGSSDFQIICAGMDNDYGRGGNFPLDAGHSAGDEDNLTNFARGRLGDAQP